MRSKATDEKVARKFKKPYVSTTTPQNADAMEERVAALPQRLNWTRIAVARIPGRGPGGAQFAREGGGVADMPIFGSGAPA